MSNSPKKDTPVKTETPIISDWKEARTWIAIVVLGISILGVIIMGWVMIHNAEATEKDETAKYVLTAILPLLGTWVGTVLAFYFSKDNFEVATRSAKAFLGVEEKLAAIAVKDVMISEGDMFYAKEDDDGKIVLKEWLEKIDQKKLGQRLPILSSKTNARYVIHRSIFNEFIAYKAIAGTPQSDIEKLTLADLVNEKPELKSLIESFGAVKQVATLDKVKVILEQSNRIQDVFVTKNGDRDGKVLGWITNVILEEYSRI
jgi:hypothetical protein